MRRFTLPNLFLTVDGDDSHLEQIYPGLYEEKDHQKSSPKSTRSPKSKKSTCNHHLTEEVGETPAGSGDIERTSASPLSSPASPRRWKSPFEQVSLGNRQPSKGCLLATTFGIAEEGKRVSLSDLQEKEKGHVQNKVLSERPTSPCPYCGGCQDACLKSLGVSPDDGSRSPTPVSPRERMCAYFDKNLNPTAKSHPGREGRRSPQRRIEEDRYPFPSTMTRSQRSHSLATPGAIDQVTRFKRIHERRPDALFVRLKTSLTKEVQDLTISSSASPQSTSPLRAPSPLPTLVSSPIEEKEEENVNQSEN